MRPRTLTSLAIDRAGNTYYTNGQNLQKLSGSVTTNIGLPGSFEGDGIPTQSAHFTAGAVALDSKGNRYVSDYYSKRILQLAVAAPPAIPVISQNGVVNSTSYAGGAVTGGELISIFVQNLAQGTAIFSLNDIRVEPALLSTKVVVAGTAVPVISVSAGQVNAILPYEIPDNSVSLQIEVDGVAAQPIQIPVARAAPGLFTADASGSGTGAIVNQDGTVNSAVHPAPRGSIVSLYGTGAGILSPRLLDDGYLELPAVLSGLENKAIAQISGQDAPVAYAGVAPSLVAGVVQINVSVPMSVAAGAADLTVAVAGQTSNKVTLWVR